MTDTGNALAKVQQLNREILTLKQSLTTKETAFKSAVEEKKKMENDLKLKEQEYKQKEQELQKIKIEIPQIKRKIIDLDSNSRKINDIEIPNLRKELKIREDDSAKIKRELEEAEKRSRDFPKK